MLHFETLYSSLWMYIYKWIRSHDWCFYCFAWSKKENCCVALKWNFWIFGSVSWIVFLNYYCFKEAPKVQKFGCIFHLPPPPQNRWKNTQSEKKIDFLLFYFRRWISHWGQHIIFLRGPYISYYKTQTLGFSNGDLRVKIASQTIMFGPWSVLEYIETDRKIFIIWPWVFVFELSIALHCHQEIKLRTSALISKCGLMLTHIIFPFFIVWRWRCFKFIWDAIRKKTKTKFTIETKYTTPTPTGSNTSIYTEIYFFHAKRITQTRF